MKRIDASQAVKTDAHLPTNAGSIKAGDKIQPHGKHNVGNQLDPDEQLIQEDLTVLDEEIDNSLADRIVLAQTEAGGAAEAGGSASATSAAATETATANAGATAAANVGAAAATEPIQGGLLIAAAGAIGVAGALGGGGGSSAPAPDTTPPIAPTLALAIDTGISGMDGITSNGQVNVTGLEAGATWEYSTDGGTTWTAGTGTSFTLTGDGLKNAIARQTDVAGNVSASSTALGFTLDTTVPAAPTLALAVDTGVAGDLVTSNGQVNVTGLEAGATWQYSTDGGTTWTAGTGTSFTLTGDGLKNAIARQTDVAGNVSASSTGVGFTLDTTVAAPTLALAVDTGVAGDLVTSNGQVNVTGLEAGATWEYSTNGGTTWTAGTGTSFTLTGDGLKNAIARQTDVAGNVSASSTGVGFTLDTTAPTTTAAITQVLDNYGLNVGALVSGTTTDDTSLDLSGTISLPLVAGEAVIVYDGAAQLGTAAVTGTNWTFTDTTLFNGHTANYTVRVEDIAGNQGAASGIFTITISAPTATAAITTVTDNVAPIIGPLTTGGVTNDQSLNLSGSITGTFNPTDVVAVYDGAVRLGTAVVAGATWTYADARILANGTAVSYTAVVENAAGDQGQMSTAFTTTIDTVAPAAPTLALAADTGASAVDSITSNGQVNVTGLEAGATWEYSGNGGVIWTAGTGTSVTLTGDGPKSVIVRQTDGAGNVSPNSAALAFTLDTTALAPSVPVLAPASDSGVVGDNITSVTTPTFTGTAEAGATVTLLNGATVLGTGTADLLGNWSITSGSLAPLPAFPNTQGTVYNISATQTDIAGNISAASATQAVTIDPWGPLAIDGTFATTGAAMTFDVQFSEGVTAASTGGLIFTKNGIVTPLPLAGIPTPITIAIPNDGFTFNIAPNTLAASDYVVLNYDSTLGTVVDAAGNPAGSGTMVFGSQGTLGSAGTAIDLTANPIPAPYGVVVIRTHQGNDTVTGTNGLDNIQTGNGSDIINGSGGSDTIDLAETVAAMDTVVLQQGMSGITGWDQVFNFDVSGVATNDRLDLRSNDIAAATVGFVDGANAGTVMSHSIGAGGIVTFGSTNTGTPMVINFGNLNDALTYLRTNLTHPGETVAFSVDLNGDGIIDGTNDGLGVYQNAAGWDIVAGLTGPNVALSTLGTTAGTNVVQLWDHTAPEIEAGSFATNTLTLNYSENIQAVAGTAGTVLLNGVGPDIVAGATITGGNVLNVTTGVAMAQTDWLLMTSGSNIADLSGNATTAGQAVAFGGTGNNTITLTGLPTVLQAMGNAGNDTITGTGNAEQLIGGTGADTINSGGGADTFVFNQGDSTVVTYVDTDLSGTVTTGDTFTFTGGADIINGALAGAGQTIVLNTPSDASPSMTAMTAFTGLVADQQYANVRGNFTAGTGVFTVDTLAGLDGLGVYDGDPTAGIQQTAAVMIGGGAFVLNPVGNTIQIV